jgi:Putative MetA-pathway of phenol degradation
MIKALQILLMIVGFSATSCGVLAQEKDMRPAAAIQDNSFLIEEAYNQEAGVIQHISNWRRLDKDWFYTFTEEWPAITQFHQISVTVPYSWLKASVANDSGFGDLQLNYRYQLSFESADRPAVSPRASVILPTGDENKGLGSGSTGFQFNLPVSKIVSDSLTLHGNAGLTTYLDVEGQRPTSYILGGSVIYAVNRDFNLMLEGLEEWNESVNALGQIEHDAAFTLSPGVRAAINLKDGTQIVLGAAAPIRFESGNTDYGAFLYLSIEHDASFLPH